MATGILVTKGSKDADFSNVLIGQLFGIPKVLYIVGISMAVIGLVTPLNDIVFVGLGMAFVVAARMIESTIETANIEAEADMDEVAADEIRQPENVNSLLQVDPIELE